MHDTSLIQIKVKSQEKEEWQQLAKENGFLSAPTMIRYLVVQYSKGKRAGIESPLTENLNLIQRINEGKEELFSGDLYELAEKYGD